jgi:GNAT superfamily N-acetyltransferase
MFSDIRVEMDNATVHRLISYAAFDGLSDAVAKTVQKYQTDPTLHFYAWIENDSIHGVCGYEVHNDKIEIHLISTCEHFRNCGVGRAMVSALVDKYHMIIEAETDDDAVLFYQKCGFETTEFVDEVKGKRHACILNSQL